MTKKSGKWIVITVIVSTVICLCVGWVIWLFLYEPPREQDIKIRDETYSFDSNNLLESVNTNSEKAFTLLKATPPVTQKHSTKSVDWGQGGFYEIAKALHQLVWHETAENWKLTRIYFNLKCSEVPFGPQYAGFKFFRFETLRGQETLITRDITIDSMKNTAEINEFDIYNVSDYWPPIDLTKSKITMEDAVKIGEANGGSSVRLKVNNECSIYGDFNMSTKYSNGWFLSYVGNSGGEPDQLLWLNVDAETGIVKKIPH
jgi:hypothetical protein